MNPFRVSFKTKMMNHNKLGRQEVKEVGIMTFYYRGRNNKSVPYSSLIYI